MEPTTIFFSKVKANAIIPGKRSEDAGYDIYACLEQEYIKLEPHQTAVLPTGIASACSPEYYFQLAERGSTGVKGIGQRSGIIDSGYRGEWFIPLTNHNKLPLYFVKPENAAALKAEIGEENAIFHITDKAICQALLLPVPKTTVQELSYTELCAIASERKAGSLGSSQK